MALPIILWSVGIFSSTYFIFYASVIGLRNVFAYFFLIFGILSIVLGIVAFYMHTNNIYLPKTLKYILIFLLCISFVTFDIAEYMIISNSVKKPEANADYCIILGASVRGTVVSHNLMTRLDKGIDYLNNNPDTKAIVTGGQGYGEDITEAKAMTDYMLSKGISPDRIIAEDQATDTYENFKYSVEKMKEDGVEAEDANVVVITNDFHTFRAKRLAMKYNFKNVSTAGSYTHWHTIPLNYIREGFAVIYYALRGRL
ncbi:MAG: YdcF family protein [Lachnospiraceae bacterium]|nr:YdcF family protein [Lachnospiraceae bacterium]